MMKRIAVAVVLLAACACAQEAVLVDGHPAVRCQSQTGKDVLTIRRELERGASQFRFPGMDWAGHEGTFTVTAENVAFTPDSGLPFVANRSDSFSVEPKEYGLKIKRAGQSKEFLFRADHTAGGGGNWHGAYLPCAKMEQALVADFSSGVAAFERITASLVPGPPPQLPKSTTVTLQLTSDPGDAQVYVDGIFRGQTDDSGQLVVESAPGDHDLRLDHADYKEWKGKVTLTGERTEQKIAMVKRGPDPLSVDEIEQALSQGMTPARCADLVKQYGVNFAVTPEIDKRLRDKGADSDLLLAIAENKR